MEPPPTKSRSASHKKVIFESSCHKWAICTSLKRNQLYYYNILTKESFYQKPASLVLTELEQQTIKSYEQKKRNTASVHEPMDVDDQIEHFKIYNQSKESGDTCQNHKFSLKKNFDKCENIETVSEIAHKTKHSSEAKVGKQTLETSSINMSLNKFKTVPFTYNSPLNFNNDILPKIQEKIDGKEMQLESSSMNNLEDDQTNSSVSKLIEHSSIGVEICNRTDDKTSFQLDSLNILPTESIVLKPSFSSQNSVPQFLKPQSPFLLPSNSGIKIQEESRDSVSRISKKPNDNCGDSDKTGDFQQLLEPINKKKVLFQNDFKIQTEIFWSKQTKYNKKIVSPVTSSVSSQNSIGDKHQTKKKRLKKRQYKRLGYWLNKKAAVELKMASEFNKNIIENSLKVTKNAGENNLPGGCSQNNLPSTSAIKDEIMDCDDSAILPETASEISQCRTKELGSKQEVNTLEYSLQSHTLKPHLLLVCDTETLTINRRFIYHLINAPPSEFPAAFVLPYVVLSELDELKSSNENPNLLHQIRRVIELLKKILHERHPRVIGQSAEDSKKQMDKDLNLSIVNNAIINCCLQYQEKGVEVVLFTNDYKLMSMANKYNISSHTKCGIVKEIEVVSIMKKRGFLDEQPWTDGNIDDDDKSSKIPDDIVNMINNHLETPLQDYLGTVLNKAMFKLYGKDLWQKRFLVKPPWKIQDICLNLRAHWEVLTKSFIDEETKRHNKNISRLLTNFSTVKWTENKTGELLDSIRHMTNRLQKYFPMETLDFLEHYKKSVILYNTEMNKHKLLLRKPSEALSQAQDIKDIDSVFEYVLSKLRNKCNETSMSFNWGRIDIDKQMLPALHEVLKEVLLYHNSTTNILKGIEGMSNHQSFVLSLSEPFVVNFILGLQTVIMLDITSNPQSSEQQTNLSGFLITPQSVIDFFWKRKNSGLLFSTLSEVKTIHDGLTEILNFIKQQIH